MNWHEQLHDQIEKFMVIHRLRHHDMLAFFSATLIGEMERKGLTQELAKKTFDKMFEEFKIKRARRNE